MLGCRVERDYNVPPDAMVNAVGSEIVAAPDDWGSLIPDSEKVSREDEVHNEIASTVHESFTNSTDTDRRRSLNRNGLYPQYPYYSTFDGCTHVLDLGGTYSAEFTHWGRATSNAYDCEGPKLKMAGTTTYPPAPLPGLVEMQANVEIAYDRGTRRFSATGCLAVGLACDSTLKRYGLGSIANPVCRWLVVEGNVCALVDYHKWAQCQNGYEYYYVDRYGWYVDANRSRDDTGSPSRGSFSLLHPSASGQPPDLTHATQRLTHWRSVAGGTAHVGHGAAVVRGAVIIGGSAARGRDGCATSRPTTDSVSAVRSTPALTSGG